ncbi:M56 family metallopeptidase [Jiulongibacter sediminis]|uniref:TonB C-terminal domain-containing protein n=1 Tax=Jiulongibacter sediminis TaxID=1605367 RepID=A0A0P7BRR5_9BACT|nr:M56 family metallopeptidase [Jiulongibacter sediminis]KPM50034.1 hypothetical protein AFM12_05670 [Jiulongibacter sediminis]TBX27062.1 hypothetical protein TK44_05675 [Jiulongibacter sediminis]
MNWLNYLLQVNLYFTLSVAFYWLVLRKETFYEINRSFLLGSSMLAFLIPFWKLGIVQDWFVTEQVSEAISVISLEEFSITAGEARPRWSWNMLGATIYFLGFGYGLLRFSVALFKLQQLLRIHSLEGQAFSVFGKVFIDKNLPDYETIRSHEDIHSRQFHSVDIFWFELVTTVCWFNPVAHLLRKEIKLLHELIADQYASEFAGKKRYAEVLVATHFKANSNILVNNFYNQSILKTRIMKLLQEKSKKRVLWKYAFAMPLFLGMLVTSVACKETIAEREPQSDLKETVVVGFKKEKQNRIPDDQVLKVVENQPEFIGGAAEMYRFIGNEIRYPSEAQKNNIEGRVFIKFVVDKEGRPRDFDVLKTPGYGLEKEAIRVLETMPNWKPGTQDGEPVNVSYVMPIFFQLEDPIK